MDGLKTSGEFLFVFLILHPGKVIVLHINGHCFLSCTLLSYAQLTSMDIRFYT